MIDGFADRRLCPLGYARSLISGFGFRISDLFQFEITNHQSQNEVVRTAGLEPAIVSLKD
jgi:hypothetical protein